MPELVKKDLRQRDAEAYFKAMRKYYEPGMTEIESKGCIVRAAVDTELITGISVDEVADLRPYDVEKLAEEVAEIIEASRKALPS